MGAGLATVIRCGGLGSSFGLVSSATLIRGTFLLQTRSISFSEGGVLEVSLKLLLDTVHLHL